MTETLILIVLVLFAYTNLKIHYNLHIRKVQVIVKCNLVYRTMGAEQKQFTDEMILDIELGEGEGLQEIQNEFARHFENTKQENYLLTDIIFVSLNRIR